MNDERRRPGEWGELLRVWAGAEPRAGFADRVLAACDAPEPPRLALVRTPPPAPATGWRGALVVCAAVAAALVSIPFVLHRRGAPRPASVAAAAASFDLGLEHD